MNTGGGNPSKLAKVHEVEQRRRTVAQLRLAGVNDQTVIAKQLNVSQATISRDFAAINEQWRKEAAADIAEVKGRQAGRIEEMLRAIWSDARKGNLYAVDRALALMKREADLFGLDAPKRSEIAGPEGDPIPIQVQTIVAVIPSSLDSDDTPALPSGLST